MGGPNNKKVMHACLIIGDSKLFVNDDMKGLLKKQKDTTAVFVYAQDVDAVWKRALKGGAKVVEPLKDQFWGDRFGMFVDPYGHSFGVATWLGPQKPAAKKPKHK